MWQQFARLSSPGQSGGRRYLDGDFQSPAEEFTSPTAQDTTVLVAGATGRVGRILVRKLLLRGYKAPQPPPPPLSPPALMTPSRTVVAAPGWPCRAESGHFPQRCKEGTGVRRGYIYLGRF